MRESLGLTTMSGRVRLVVGWLGVLHRLDLATTRQWLDEQGLRRQGISGTYSALRNPAGVPSNSPIFQMYVVAYPHLSQQTRPLHVRTKMYVDCRLVLDVRGDGRGLGDNDARRGNLKLTLVNYICVRAVTFEYSGCYARFWVYVPAFIFGLVNVPSLAARTQYCAAELLSANPLSTPSHCHHCAACARRTSSR